MKELIEKLINDFKEDKLVLMEGIYEKRLHTFAVIEGNITWVDGPESLHHLNSGELFEFKDSGKYAYHNSVTWLTTTEINVEVYKRHVYLKDYVPALERMQNINEDEEAGYYSAITKTDLIILICKLQPTSALVDGKQVNYREVVKAVLDGTATQVECSSISDLLMGHDLSKHMTVKITKRGSEYVILKVDKYRPSSTSVNQLTQVSVYTGDLLKQKYFNTKVLDEVKILKAVKCILNVD